MSRILFVIQEAGGVGKSTAARALAEAIPDVPVYEIESTTRLIEIAERVKHFPIRADRQDVLRSGGEAALSDYDEVINSLIVETRPAIVDVGANGAEALLTSFGRMAPLFGRRGRDLGIMVVAASDESAYASAEKLLKLSKSWAKAQFVLVNEYRGLSRPPASRRLSRAQKPPPWHSTIFHGRPGRSWNRLASPSCLKSTKRSLRSSWLIATGIRTGPLRRVS